MTNNNVLGILQRNILFVYQFKHTYIQRLSSVIFFLIHEGLILNYIILMCFPLSLTDIFFSYVYFTSYLEKETM